MYQQAPNPNPGLICPQVTVSDYLQACKCKGGAPVAFQYIGGGEASQFLKDLVCFGSAIGALEPLTTIRPGACDLVTVFDKTVPIPPATLDALGQVVPGEVKLIQICAPMGQALVVEKLRALPANLTSTQSGDIVFKRLAVFGFSEGFCPPGEPADGDDLGTFQNIEHVLLSPESGFDVHGRNFDLFSPGLIHIHARMWATC